ncbi:GCRV-induced gene 2p [Genypterus blacodes]|uniref:GCRV-induced gene 2p n=1 Tax=Genypterus blacodes TaxID=154954 RepID=UPI003F76E8A7
MSVSYFGWDVTYDDGSSQLGGSQAPKDQGVYTMYHGTSIANARLIIANGFRQSSAGMLGKGVYISRRMGKAQRYPLSGTAADRVVLKVHARVGRVKRIDKDNHPMQYTWNSQGYDTAWVPPKCGMLSVPSGLEEDCVFDPKRLEVLDVAMAPNTIIQNELKQLIANSVKKGDARPDSGAGNVCALCKRKTVQGSPHSTQQCWGCGKNICILMTRHVCTASA